MTQQPFNAASLRGAVDLSRLAQPGRGAGTPAGAPSPSGAPAGPTGDGASAGAGAPQGLVVEGTDANFQEVMTASARVPAVLVLWASSQPETKQALDTVVEIARGLDGRLQVISVDGAANPTVTQALAQALQLQGLPFTLGLVGGQPVPMFEGMYPAEQVRGVIDQLLQLAVQQGVTGRLEGGAADGGQDGGQEGQPEPELPPLHQEAYDAIDRGDLDAALAAYDKALAQDPKDELAEVGRAQVQLLKRTEGVDLQQARDAAAAAPQDVEAQITVADLDLLGGHIEDAFTRLIDLVKVTAGADRDRVRTHLLELFAVVGNNDERVRKGRSSLMSALF